MKNRDLLILMGCYALIGGAVQAETIQLTVDKAVELSLKNNLTLKVEDLQLQSKKRSKDLAWNAFIPKTSVGGSLSHLNQPSQLVSDLVPLAEQFGVSASNLVTPDWIVAGKFSSELDISLALFDGIRHTVLDYQAGLIESQTARQSLIRDTKKAFYNLLLLKENLATFEDQLETAEKHYQKEKRNFETGIGSEFSMLDAQVAWENMKPGLDEMRISAAVAELSFKQMLGLDRATTLDIQGSFDPQAVPLDNEKLVDVAINQNPALASLRQTIAIQKNLRRGQFDLDYFPTLGLSFSADPTFQKDPFANPWFTNISTDWYQNTGAFSVFLNLPLDGFLPFSSTAVTLANMDDSIAQLQTNLLITIQSTEVRITSLVLQVEKSRRTVERLELNVELASRAYQMAEKGFESGAYELLQVEDADNKLREAKYNVLSEKYAYLSGLFDLEYETNQSLTVK
jgi:outer membrane protein TolC